MEKEDKIEMFNNRLKFRCGVTLGYFNEEGEELELLFIFEPKTIANGATTAGIDLFTLEKYVNQIELTDYERNSLWQNLYQYECDDWFNIDVDFIDQCVGFKDKNGNLIYDNDIVKTDAGNIYYIQWDVKSGSFREEDPDVTNMIYQAGHHLTLWAELYSKRYTIIGNLHTDKNLFQKNMGITKNE